MRALLTKIAALPSGSEQYNPRAEERPGGRFRNSTGLSHVAGRPEVGSLTDDLSLVVDAGDPGAGVAAQIEKLKSTRFGPHRGLTLIATHHFARIVDGRGQKAGAEDEAAAGGPQESLTG